MFAYHKAQHIRPVEDLERDLIEIIKYGSKIFTEPDIKKKGKQKVSPFIYIAALHNIFCVFKGHQLFKSFGFTLAPEHTVKKRKTTLLKQYQTWMYKPEICNWINKETAERLTEYVLPIELAALLESNMKTTIE